MAKQLLRIDLDTSFFLFGISCHLKDYRFAWTINKSLRDDFKKSKAPQFKGKSAEKKRKMAVAAYLSKQNEK